MQKTENRKVENRGNHLREMPRRSFLKTVAGGLALAGVAAAGLPMSGLLSGCAGPGSFDGWRITQYGNPEGNQSMFYTIEDRAGRLVLIDGGYTIDTDQMRQIIGRFKNHVTAWIITHPHPDHVGPFNEIMADPGKIQVDAVITIKVNGDRYRGTAQDYDRIEEWERMEEVLAGLSQVHYLKEDDELDLLGLHLKVLHAWNEETDALEVNLCNNGSLMFTLTGKEETFLFCADVENETEDYVIERHGKELERVDYVQTGHHGNWGLTTAFYDHLQRVGTAFVDAPLWLTDTIDGPYDCWKLIEYFEGRGVELYSFRTTPNVILLR